jgi:hypothetical protein
VPVDPRWPPCAVEGLEDGESSETLAVAPYPSVTGRGSRDRGGTPWRVREGLVVFLSNGNCG